MKGNELQKIGTDLLLRHGAIDPADAVLLIGNDLDYCVSALQHKHTGSVEVMQLTEVTAKPGALQDRRWAVVCVLDSRLEASTLNRLLAQIRDLHADRVLHLEQSDQWSLSQSLALGFSHVHSSDSVDLYEFDILTYKKAPDWLNARHWANPEQWDKHRW